MMLPVEFLKFWFWIALREIIGFFASLNSAFLQLFSLPLLIKTYFKPWKNEYRKGLVRFSIGMGIFIKTFVIIADLILLIALVLSEILFFLGFLAWPVATFFVINQRLPFSVSIFCIVAIFLIFRKKPPYDIKKSKKSTRALIKSFLKRKDVKFFLQKAEIDKNEIKLLEIPKEDVLGNTEKTVSPLDFFVSYLLLTEKQTELLFQKQLKQKDILAILQWTKSTFPVVVNKPFRINFWGEGIGEGWVYGWTIETSKYMVDVTSDAVNTEPMIFGRDKEYEEIVGTLSGNKSCLLVGEPGSGREALVMTLAYKSFLGDLQGSLRHQRFFRLLTDTLLAGSENQGQLEERLDNLIAEISHAGNVIIFVPNLENILGASTFNLDLSGALVPYLERGIIRIIATITPSSYKRFVASRHSLANVLETIRLEEPNSELLLQMLLKKSLEIERANKITIPYKAVLAAANFANKYLQDKIAPGAGITLLEDVASTVCVKGEKNMQEQDVIEKVENRTKIKVGQPKKAERELLLHLEEELHKRIVGQNEAVLELAESVRRLRAGLGDSKKPISFLFLGPTGVGKTETAKALSSIYYGGEKKMIRFDMSEYSTENSVGRFLGGAADSKGLTDKVFDNPYSLVLLDEFEKSNPKIVDLFLQVFDDGRLTDNAGRTVSFVDNIIIATSNAGSEYIREEVEKGTAIDKNFQKKLLNYLQQKAIFRPELLNRFDGIIVFRPLMREEIKQVTRFLLGDVGEKLQDKDVAVVFAETAVEKIANEGFDMEFGARPIRRFIQDNIEDILAQKILQEKIKRGDKINVCVDSSNNFRMEVEGAA